MGHRRAQRHPRRARRGAGRARRAHRRVDAHARPLRGRGVAPSRRRARERWSRDPEDRIDHDPGTSEWGLWPTAHHREMGDVRVDGIPLHFSETDWSIERGGPCLGEHNHQVFSRAARPRRRRDRAARGGRCGVSPDMPTGALGRAQGRGAGVGARRARGQDARRPRRRRDRRRTARWSRQPRRTDPFADDVDDPERSLWWWYYNTSKRGVVLDLATAGRASSSSAVWWPTPTSCSRARRPAVWPRSDSTTPSCAPTTSG